ncbi:MAG: hypothetical protein SH821_12180 [Phototrophicales bacterium]|nr:hypothetical protein [Phototrophicales bacterium]
MANQNSNQPNDSENAIMRALEESNTTSPTTISEARGLVGKMIQALEQTKADGTSTQEAKKIISGAEVEPPWLLQQFFQGDIKIDEELSGRFPALPVMSTIKTRIAGTKMPRGVAMLSAQDNSAGVIFDADKTSRMVQLSFITNSMLSLRFSLRSLNNVDRARWVTLMKREKGGVAFLWGPKRWEEDYIISVSKRYYTSLFAFSTRHYEAAVRLIPEVTINLVEWLEEFWNEDPPVLPADEPTSTILDSW